MVIKAYRKPYNAEQPEQVGEGFEQPVACLRFRLVARETTRRARRHRRCPRAPEGTAPRSKHDALGAKPGHAVLVEPWRALLPAQTVDAAFEGV
ncbi:hypothetical protein [Mesorhizobium sp. M1A.F.Ca.IN.022.07.1.1]|uniref:hypothetical protein n=1 Tax=Mesorhizobium sp. M1A.F.Ca.IN.022.07.1.1 TaxID=2496767 RepID=UPI0019D0D1FE|nr:hypothetical protein [Mesorhizobium sp. M1A.F.Ca.IN.022.07.1.1]